jgi:glycosyltransferase involved in cell wall biosynthesis
MNILIVCQYFWPENFRINDLCEGLASRGHTVTVLTGKPNYPEGVIYKEYKENPKKFENLGKINICRVPIFPRGKGSFSLLFNYISYFFSATLFGIFKLRRLKFDVVFCCQLSPITMALPAIAIKKRRKIPLVMWSLDLWPESVVAVNKIRSPFLLKIIGYLVSFIYKRCEVILGQTESYLSSLNRYNKGFAKLEVFPNWAEPIFENISFGKNDLKKINVVFAGNLGEAQDLGALVECGKILYEKNCNVVFTIVGDGSKKEWFESAVNHFGLSSMFSFHGRQPLSAMPTFYASADMAIVTLNSDYISSCTIPGKVQSYMVAGLPILAMIDGEGAKLVNEAGCGFACGAGNFLALANLIIDASGYSSNELKALGEKGKAYAADFFSREQALDRLELTFESLVKREAL